MKETASTALFSLQRARRKLATLGVLLVTAAIGYHALFGANGAVVYKKKRDEYRRLQEEIQQLDRDNGELAKHVKALKTDPKAIEQEAREGMHYARPGEIIYTEPASPTQSDDKTAKK